MTHKAVTQAVAKTKKALSPDSIDAFLVHLDRVMQTPAGSDAVLATVCYGARLLAVLFNTPAGRQLVAAAGLLSPTDMRSLPAKQSTAQAQDLYKRLNALGSLTSELRTMTRLWGMLSMYVWARGLVKQLLAQQKKEIKEAWSAKTTAASLVAWTQLSSCVAFQVLENLAYLGQRGILPVSAAAQARAYRWSSRSFCVYIAVELGRLAAAMTSSRRGDAEQRAQLFELQRSTMRYVAFAPSTLHWGMEKGFLGEPAIAVLGWVPAALQLHKVWYETK